MRTLLFSAAILASLGFAVLQNPAVQQGTDPMMTQGCPVTIEDTGIAAADTVDGIALVFTSEKRQPAELQKRVERMTNMHNATSGKPICTEEGSHYRQVRGDTKRSAPELHAAGSSAAGSAQDSGSWNGRAHEER